MKKSAVITGVAGGMGTAAARILIGHGYEVFGIDRKEPESLNGLHFIKTDLTDPKSVEEAFRTISCQAETISAVIHLSGIYDLNSLVEMPEEDFIRIFNINLFAVYRVNKAFLPLMEKGCRIVIVSSELAPLDPLPFTGIYGITKTALEKYAYSLRMELQLLGHKVVVIRPGAVETDLLNVSTSRLDDFCRQTTHYACNSERFRKIVDSVETKKIPPERIAALVWKAVSASRPRLLYNINRNPLLRILNYLPTGLQNRIIRMILSKPA